MAAQKRPDVIVEDGAVYVLRPGTPVYVKTNDISAMIGKSNQWVGQLVSQGTLNKRSTPHGAMFDVAAAMRAYCDMLEAREAQHAKSPDELKRESAKSAADVTLKVARATVAKLEAEELQGKMHRSEDVAAMTEDLIYAMRNALLALPGRLAVDTANAKTAAETSEIIRREVYEVMKELSNYKYDPAKYEERVRDRKRWEIAKGGDADDTEV